MRLITVGDIELSGNPGLVIECSPEEARQVAPLLYTDVCVSRPSAVGDDEPIDLVPTAASEEIDRLRAELAAAAQRATAPRTVRRLICDALADGRSPRVTVTHRPKAGDFAVGLYSERVERTSSGADLPLPAVVLDDGVRVHINAITSVDGVEPAKCSRCGSADLSGDHTECF